MSESQDQIEALSKKYLDGKGTNIDWLKSMDDIAKHLDGNGKQAIETGKTKMNELTVKWQDGKVSLDDYKKGFMDIVHQMEYDGKDAQEKAKIRLSDLNEQFMDGKLSFDQYHQGVDDVNKSLADYNRFQPAKKTFEANFGDFTKGLDDVLGKLGKIAEKTVIPPLQWQTVGPNGQITTSYSPPAPVRDNPTGGAYRPGGPNVPGYASGTDFAPGGPALVGENGLEFMNVFGRIFSVNSPTFLGNLPRGSQVTPVNNISNITHALGGNKQEVHNHYYNFQANYKYQERENLMRDVKQFQLLNSKT